MDGALKLWAVIVAVGAINYLARLSFIEFFAQRRVPALLAQARRYVPVAMHTALLLPMMLATSIGAAPELGPRVPAAIFAAVVAYYTRSTLRTLGAGMAALWLLQALSGAR